MPTWWNASMVFRRVGLFCFQWPSWLTDHRQCEGNIMIHQFGRPGLRGAALLAVLGLGTSPAHAANYWKNSVVTGNWPATFVD
jgi:hypothetical protein